MAIVAGALLVLGLVAGGVGSIVSLIDTEDGAAPAFPFDNSDQGDAGQGDGDPDVGPVEASLQAKIDEYKEGQVDGWLWAKIPDNEYNRTAVTAFLYLLIDMKLAASFGADTSTYLDDADALEQKLLNQEPLGSDISIKLSDRTFTYDGETGEGGFTDN